MDCQSNRGVQATEDRLAVEVPRGVGLQIIKVPDHPGQ